MHIPAGLIQPSAQVNMAFLYFLADAFINTFGITKPTPAARRQAAFFILGMSVLVLVGVTVAGIAIHLTMR